MGELDHTIEKERKLIEMLGYHFIGPDHNYRWIITDKNLNQVGYIQFKKLRNGNKKKGIPKIFGYETFIDSPTFTTHFTRESNDENGNLIEDDEYHYSFDVKRKNGELDHVEMSCGDFPSITMWSKKYGFISFHIGCQGMYLNFKSKTEHFNIEEILVCQNADEEHHANKEYTYQIRNCDKSIELVDDQPMGRTSREISGVQAYDDPNHLKVSLRTWKNGALRYRRDDQVDGTIEEMIQKHQMGLDCFSHFRHHLNHILPFKKDVMSSMVRKDIVDQERLSIFFPDYYEKEANQGKK